MPPEPQTTPAASLQVIRGNCTALFAFDLGFAINLNKAQELLSSLEPTQRESLKHTRRAPKYFEYQPAPIRITRAGVPVAVGRFTTLATIEALLYDFGAVSISFSISLTGPINDLVPLSSDLYENEALLTEARRVVAELMTIVSPAVSKPDVAQFVEDYLVFNIEEWGCAPDRAIADWTDTNRALLARVLRSEANAQSPQEVDDAVGHRIAYSNQDVALIDWNAAVLFGKDMQDVVAVLEFANVELLEMRFLDDQLDRALSEAYEATQRGERRGFFTRSAGELHRIARLQMDSAILFEGVNNALKLLGDPYLSRVYRLAAQRLHLPDWDASIIRKLGTVESIYEKFNDRQTSRRMEVLEWIIILMIGFEIVWSIFRR